MHPHITQLLLCVTLLGCQKPAAETRLNPLKQSTRGFREINTSDITYYLQDHQINSIQVESEARKAFNKSCSLLGIKTYKHNLHYFVFNSPEDIEHAIGVRINGGAYTQSNCIMSVYSKQLNTLASAHEFTHVISHNEWGSPSIAWLDEGLAVYSDDAWWGYPLHPLAKKIKQLGKLKPVTELRKKAVFGTGDSVYAHPQAGSLVKYIYEKYGPAFVKQIWSNGDHSPDRHQVLQSLEREWLAFLDTVQPLNANYP
jgi:hypothetical protein